MSAVAAGTLVAAGPAAALDAATISGWVVEDDGVTVPNGVNVQFWSLEDDGVGGTYWDDAGIVDVDPSTGAFIDTSLTPGTYVVQVLATPQWNIAYWGDARYFEDAATVTVADGDAFSTGTIDLEPRSIETFRVTGTDRFGTSVKVAEELFPPGEVPVDGIPVAYITNGLNYPDALSAGPAAIFNGGVVLLTYPWALPSVVATELLRLEPQRVVVLGGTNSVSAAVESQIEGMAFAPDVDRITGTDRFGTSRAVARDTFLAPGSPVGSNVAFIATGLNYPDALAAGPAAGQQFAPVILVNGQANALDVDSLALLVELDVVQLYIIGGLPSVSAGIQSQLEGIYSTELVERLTGTDRFGTAVDIALEFFAASDHAYLATGLNFPDALAGAPLAGFYGAPLYLSRQDCIQPAVLADIEDVGANGVWLLGGPPSLSANVANLGVC
ncbi:cell wall-binding repeat-containing protein [Pseudolysinimonas sp.]|uniref:cell wall-binding repeat-containing protein n=1 Tax=Pseudolysinimonas sp. TaxID=2680009 RepID=UPI00286A2AB1|nr:cell wall-binding repeat-containing protein [Pseudolysinimonas sp.]